MKVDKNIRNLLLGEDETHMVSASACIYLGQKYTFDPINDTEREEMRLNLVKLINKKSWAKIILTNIFNNG